jgi:ribonuclease Z
VRRGDDLLLVDAGEGSRSQLRRYGAGVGAVRRVYVTHMHGDHCFGLAGLLCDISRVSMHARQAALPGSCEPWP